MVAASIMCRAGNCQIESLSHPYLSVFLDSHCSNVCLCEVSQLLKEYVNE